MISSTQATTRAEEGKQSADSITELNYDDVLLGRGAPAIDNEGNVRFRALVSSRRAEYLVASKRDEKDVISRQIVDTIRKRGGRFLVKVDSTDAQAEGSDSWTSADEDTILKKVKQALRDKNTQEENPRPRRRKRVNRGNLVPEEESESEPSEQKVEEQKLASSEGSLSARPHPGLGTLLHGRNLGAILGQPRISGSPVSSQGVEPMPANGSREAQLAALIQQVRQAQSHSSPSMVNTAQYLPHYLGSAPQLLQRFPADSSFEAGFAGLGAAQPIPLHLLSFGSPQALNSDPLLGNLSNLLGSTNDDRHVSAMNDSDVLIELRKRILLQQGLASQGISNSLQTTGTSCEDIIQEAILKHRFGSSLAQARTSILNASLFEVSLLLVCCDFGLPLMPITGWAEQSSWKWQTLAERILQRSVLQGAGRASYISMAAHCNVDMESVQRTSLLAASLARNNQELARLTVMLLLKMNKLSSSSVIGTRSARSAGGGGDSSLHSSVASFTGTDRDSQSRVDDSTLVTTRILLQQWASHLGIVTEGGQVIALSSEDLADPSDRSFRGVAPLDGRNCECLFVMIGTLTQLRRVLSRYNDQAILAALATFPDRHRSPGINAAWWASGDVSQKDLWLIKSALQNGVSATMDLDARPIGAPGVTLRQSLLLVGDVENRLELVGSFLVSHFESVSRKKVTDERRLALQAQLR